MTDAWTPLAETTLSSSASDVTFGSLGSSYRDLLIIATIDNSANTELFIQFNGDTSTYVSLRLQGAGTTAAANTHSGTSMRLVGNGDIMTDFSFQAVINIFDYASTAVHKNVLSRTSSSNGIDLTAGRWPSTSAITSVKLSPNTGTFEAGSKFQLWGLNII